MKISLEQQKMELDTKRNSFLEERKLWESQNRPEEYVDTRCESIVNLFCCLQVECIASLINNIK